jgi:hypothetical protein
MTHTVAVQIDVALAAGNNEALAALCEARHMQETDVAAAKDELRRLYDLLRARGLALVRIPGHGPCFFIAVAVALGCGFAKSLRLRQGYAR